MIDSRPLRRIRRATDSGIDVEAGATWARLTAARRAFDPANVLNPYPRMF